ncbi:uncharacterized protein LOC143529619 [Bidens hawaiensis]|uniref:uncharacterized protein LOC143529619 n=1 Tax=Bidens hawaiensis TaxID=980011 RepID=UPI0040494F81
MNQSIVEGINARLGRYGRNWLEEFPSFLWAIRTTENTSHGKTAYSIIFGSEAIIPAEIGVNSKRVRNINEESNDSEVLLNLDPLKEAREQAVIEEARYKKKLEAFYNTRVRKEVFKLRDLVLSNNEAIRQFDTRKLGPKWEGPYVIKEAHSGGSYKLNDMEGKKVPHHWSGMHIRKFIV